MEQKEMYIPIADWNKFYAYPTVNGMRRRFERRETNGYQTAFLKDGWRVVVKAMEFFRCMEQIGGNYNIKNKEKKC